MVGFGRFDMMRKDERQSSAVDLGNIITIEEFLGLLAAIKLSPHEVSGARGNARRIRPSMGIICGEVKLGSKGK
jgi:hypothetical protein